jgi:hypothetical protein
MPGKGKWVVDTFLGQIGSLLTFIQKQCVMKIHSNVSNLVRSCLDLMVRTLIILLAVLNLLALLTLLTLLIPLTLLTMLIQLGGVGQGTREGKRGIGEHNTLTTLISS